MVTLCFIWFHWKKRSKLPIAIAIEKYEKIFSIKILNLHQKPLDVTNHSVAREVVTFFTLPPGEYIVMPQTNVSTCFGKSDINCPNVQVPNCDNNDNHDNDGIDQVPNCDGKFLLRILTDEQSNIW